MSVVANAIGCRRGGRMGYAVASSGGGSPPSSPTIFVQYNASPVGAGVGWGYVVGATGYKVYRDIDGGGYVEISDQPSVNYVDTGVVLGQVCSYKVTAYNLNGESAPSSIGSVHILAPSLTSLSYDGVNTTSAFVHWVDSNASIAGTVYSVYYREVTGPPDWILFASGVSGDNLQVTGLNSNTEIAIKVAADGIFGDDEIIPGGTAFITATLAAPVISITDNISSLHIQWSAVDEATGYAVLVDFGSGFFSFGSVTEPEAFVNAGSYGDTVYVYVVPYNDGGSGLQSNTVSSTISFLPSFSDIHLESDNNISAPVESDTLTCVFTVVGYPSPTVSYQWKSSTDGSTYSDIPGETSAFLSLSGLAGNKVKCFATATNAAGDVTEQTIGSEWIS